MTQATVLMVPQLGVEVTPGTPVAATKSLGAMRIEPAFDVNIEPFRASGNKFNNFTTLMRERMTASTPGKPTYTEIVYPLSGILGAVTPALATTPTPATLAYEWVFSPNHDAADDPVTYTIEAKGVDRSFRFAYGLWNQFGLSVARNPSGGAADLSGSMLGKAYEDGITPTDSASITALDLIPMTPLQFDVYIDDDAATLGTTQIGKAFMGNWNYGPAYNVAEYLDSSESSFSGHYAIEIDSTMELTFERDAAGSALLAAMRSNTTKFIRLAAVGPEIETGHNYEFRIDFAGQIVTPSLGDQDGLATIGYTFTNVYDPTWEKSLEVYVKNDVQAL